MGPFDFIKAINTHKNIMKDGDPLTEKDYIPFLVNRGLSFFQAEDGIRDFCLSRGLGDVYKRQLLLMTVYG